MSAGHENVFIHATADVSPKARVGPGTSIWQQVQVRDDAEIGRECILGKGVFIDLGVRIGDRCKLQNGVYVFRGMNLDDGVFLGPGVMLLNDKNPRAINSDGTLKADADWKVSGGLIGYGAAVGGGAIVLPGVSIGRFGLVGSGSVVTRNVPDHAVVYGNPARLRGFACDCGHMLPPGEAGPDGVDLACSDCGRHTVIPAATYRQAQN